MAVMVTSRREIRARLLVAWLALALCPAGGALAQGFGGTVTDMLVRGDSLLAQKRPNEAIVQYQEARTLCTTPAEMVQSLQGEARARIQLGQPLPAAGLMEEAVALSPDDPRAADLLFGAGQVRKSAGELDKAIDLMRRALEKSPTPDLLPLVKIQLAQALRMRSRPQEAVETLKDFETSFPDHKTLPNVLYMQSLINHDLERLEESEAGYRSLITRFPGTVAAIEAHFELGAVLADRGRRAEAAESYRKFVSFNPGSPLAAAALERAGDLLLLRSPKESIQLYALARVKEKANPRPPFADLGLSRWLPVKKTLAEALSRVWVLAVVAVAALGAAVLIGRYLVRRLRRHPDPVQA
jgi:tetratricopeptide (TPR) repeat protein